MPITRINIFEAKDGQIDALRQFLQRVVLIVQKIDGCLSCRAVQSTASPNRFVVIEEWVTQAAHEASVKQIPPEMLREAMALVTGMPKGEYFQ